jgi:hypothetical protein
VDFGTGLLKQSHPPTTRARFGWLG